MHGSLSADWIRRLNALQLFLVGVIIIMPIAWMVLGSLKESYEVNLSGTAAIGRVDPVLKPKVGDRLTLGPQPAKFHLFDAVTGQVLT